MGYAITCYFTVAESDYPQGRDQTSDITFANDNFGGTVTFGGAEFVSSGVTYVRGPNGLSGQSVYRKDFLARVSVEGSGIGTDGHIIQFASHAGTVITLADGGIYDATQNPIKAAGQYPLVDGKTVAADLSLHPRLQFLNVETIGRVQVTDTGGGVIGHHLDLYLGIGRQKCSTFESSQPYGFYGIFVVTN